MSKTEKIFRELIEKLNLRFKVDTDRSIMVYGTGKRKFLFTMFSYNPTHVSLVLLASHKKTKTKYLQDLGKLKVDFEIIQDGDTEFVATLPINQVERIIEKFKFKKYTK